MVLFLFPSGMADSDTLGMRLYKSRTLYGMLPVTEDRSAMVQSVLKLGIKVVIPDTLQTTSNAWHDVLLALKACHHPVQRMGEYLNTCNQPAPAPPAAPPMQPGAGAGQYPAHA